MAQQINLFNPVFRKQRKDFSAVAMLQALGLLLGGILAFYGYVYNETRTLSRNAVETGRLLKAQSEQLGQFMRDFSPQGKSRQLEDEAARLAAQLKLREDLMGVLRTGGLGNADGFGRYLTAFAHQPVAGVWLTGFSIGADEAELVVNGRALHPDLVPAFIRALNREEVMRGRRVSELRLTAREERDATGAAAPGASPAEPGKKAAALGRFVEFSLIASRGTAAGGSAGAAGSTSGAADAGTAAKGGAR